MQNGQFNNPLQNITRANQASMDNGGKAQLTDDQRQVTHQSEHLQLVLFPCLYPPMIPCKKEQYRVKQEEITDNDALPEKTIRLIIIPHITPPNISFIVI
jgi:hypothetical protein